MPGRKIISTGASACDHWYFIVQMVIVTTSFIAVLILIKRYKQRKRNNVTLKYSETQTDSINW